MNGLLKKIPLNAWLLAVAIAAALVAVRAPWLEFPLTAPLRGLDMASTDPALWRRLPALPFLLCFLAGLACAALGWHRLTAWVLGAALCALLAVPGLALLVDASWFEQFLREAMDLQKMLVFMNSFVDSPNISFNLLAIRDAENYGYLDSRLGIILSMLGWGWMIALLATLVCLLLLRQLGRLPLPAGLPLSLLVGLLGLLVAGSGSLAGDFYYRQADQRMALGDYAGALNAYTAAIEHDGQLANSNTLMLNLSRASYQLYGPDSAFGRMYLVVARSGNLTTLNASLLDAVIAEPAQGPLGQPLKQLALRLQAELWAKRGIQAFRRNEFSAAELAFRRARERQPEWLHLQYFLARTLWKLRAYDESLDGLQALTQRLHNPSLLANLYSTIGDVYASAGQPALSRQAYQKAYSLDGKGNLWAAKGLGGT